MTTIPKQYLYHHSVAPYLQGVSDSRIEMPVFTFLVEGGDSLMLIDTGMAWSERASAYHHPGSRQPQGCAITEQLGKAGYRPEDVGVVVFTHLHWDHIYYMEKFTQAEFIAHEREYQFALDPIPLYYKSYEHPNLYRKAAEKITRPFEGIPIKTVRGETEIMPGVRVFETPGHSPGHQSVEIDTKTGPYICCGDSVFVWDNLKPVAEIEYDITPPGRYADIVATWKSIEAQKERAAGPERILPCHEKALLEVVKKTPVLGL